MTDIHLLGIRHHGPGSCRNILQELERIRPDLILLEGPAEAEALMPFVSDGQMKPPVALLGYQPDAPQNAVFYPFADFSPEWQALRYALRENVTLRFFDLPLAHSLAFEAEKKDGSEPVEANRLKRTMKLLNTRAIRLTCWQKQPVIPTVNRGGT